MNIQKKQLYDVNIESYSSEGFGICRVDGFVVFVRDAAVGDKCQIRVIKVLKNFAYARIEQLYTPSSARVSSECTVFPMCGGCDFWHISYEEELRLKKERVEDALQLSLIHI
ncbi:MAG: TRAM domain-containing protein [Clostridiales bacterium]|nr:TRAM domain-containing protein [Clostridiales bacterium]